LSVSEYDQREGGDSWRIFREHRLLVLAVLILAIAAAGIYHFTATSQYVSEADVLVTPVPGGDDTFTGLGLPSDQAGSVLSVARLMTTPLITDRVRNELHLKQSNDELLQQLTILPLQQSGLITVRAKSSSPEEAAKIANTMASVLIAQRTGVFQTRVKATITDLTSRLAALKGRRGVSDEVRGLQARIGALGGFIGQQDPTLDVWSAAVAPDKKAPVSLIGSLLVFLAALLLGAGAAVLYVKLDPRLSSADKLPGGLPILATIPKMPDSAGSSLTGSSTPLPEDVLLASRLVRSLMSSDTQPGKPKVVLVTSPASPEEKSLISLGVAQAYAAVGNRVVMIEGDVRQPMLAAALGVDRDDRGLVGVLAGRRVAPALRPSASQARISLLPLEAGASGFEMASPRRLSDVITEIGLEAEVVVIDAATLSYLPDVLSLSAVADDVVVVVALGSTNVDPLRRTVRTLEQLHTPLTGYVVVEKGMRSVAGKVAVPTRPAPAPALTVAPAPSPQRRPVEPNGEVPAQPSVAARPRAR
jgi:Mrp family chromosome partitioning ATPase